MLMAKISYGKLAVTFYHPKKGSRYAFPAPGTKDALTLTSVTGRPLASKSPSQAK
jgi:hypothetical protein